MYLFERNRVEADTVRSGSEDRLNMNELQNRCPNRTMFGMITHQTEPQVRFGQRCPDRASVQNQEAVTSRHLLHLR